MQAPSRRLKRLRKARPPIPPHVAKDVVEARRLHDLVAEQDRKGYWGIVQGEHALGRIEFEEAAGAKVTDPEVRPGVEPPHAEG